MDIWIMAAIKGGRGNRKWNRLIARCGENRLNIGK